MERRNTIQKEMVLEAVRKLHNHATAEEVYAFIAKDHPSIGKGTVYRNLNILEEEGQITKVAISDGADRFDHITEEHSHLKCSVCGKLTDIKTTGLPKLSSIVIDNNGTEIKGFEIMFSGLCRECRTKISQK